MMYTETLCTLVCHEQKYPTGTLILLLALNGVFSTTCSSKSGYHFSKSVLWNQMEKFDIDTTCPCVAMTTTLPQCHIHHLIIRLNHVITSIKRTYKLFQGTITLPHPFSCTDIDRHHSSASRRHPELTGILLESYEAISKVTLDVAIVQHHNNSRVQDFPTTDLGSVLCYMKRLLLTTDVSPSVTAHTVTLQHKNIEQMVPYTCQTLKDAFHVLRQVKSDILEKFYSRFR